VSKIAQIRKRKASEPLQKPTKAKRARSDDLLESLREIQQTQIQQMRVMKHLTSSCNLEHVTPIHPEGTRNYE